MTDKPTPGPWEWDAGDDGTEYSHRYSDIFIDGGNVIIASFNDRIPEGLANARLIVAACNAVQSLADKLSVDPVKLAEKLADGGLVELVEALDHLADISAIIGYDASGIARQDHAELRENLDAARAILSRLREGGER